MDIVRTWEIQILKASLLPISAPLKPNPHYNIRSLQNGAWLLMERAASSRTIESKERGSPCSSSELPGTTKPRKGLRQNLIRFGIHWVSYSLKPQSYPSTFLSPSVLRESSQPARVKERKGLRMDPFLSSAEETQNAGQRPRGRSRPPRIPTKPTNNTQHGPEARRQDSRSPPSRRARAFIAPS